MVYAHTRSHEPENQARRYWDEASTPLFPFGYGLSYGRFEYANLTVDQPAVTASGTVTVSVEVTNTADREADEVVQLYIHQRHGSASRPVRELKGFRRVTLAAGESRTLQFPVGPNERRYWNAAVRDWVTDSSTFDVWVGGDSTAQLSTRFDVTEAELAAEPARLTSVRRRRLEHLVRLAIDAFELVLVRLPSLRFFLDSRLALIAWPRSGIG